MKAEITEADLRLPRHGKEIYGEGFEEPVRAGRWLIDATGKCGTCGCVCHELAVSYPEARREVAGYCLKQCAEHPIPTTEEELQASEADVEVPQVRFLYVGAQSFDGIEHGIEGAPVELRVWFDEDCVSAGAESLRQRHAWRYARYLRRSVQYDTP